MEAALERLASLYGIEPGYHDIWGQWRPTPQHTLRRLLEALGVDAKDPSAADSALRGFERRRWERVVAPLTVLRRAELERGMRVQLPESALAGALSLRLAEEGGAVREERFDAPGLARLEDFEQDGARSVALRLPLPVDLPEGYHAITILSGAGVLGEGLVAVAPERCYLPPMIADGARVWGTTVQLYGLRSARNAGVGDFTDLRHCAEAWGERGAAIVGTNPLHALSLLDPGHASPYSPSSRLFLNPIYLDVEAIEDFAEIAAADATFTARWRAQCEKLRAAETVDYAAVSQAKRAIFETLHAHFRGRHLAAGSARARQFAQFRAARGMALRHHALHEALRELHGVPWRQWPEVHRDPASAHVRDFAREHAQGVELHEYLQWQADLQLARAQERCRELGMAVGLYADLAISIGPEGSEAWANQHLYALGASVGAPPDQFNVRGQDWGLPPLDPYRLQEAAYAPLVATLRANMLHAGALRIDHVMGLARLWWVPSGAAPDEGAYVRYPADDLFGLVALESHRNRCLVIGEDLGTVADDLRRRLEGAEIFSYRVVLFERDGGEFRSPATYPRRALVTWSTHDLPTLAGWWREEDLRTREALGLLAGEALVAERAERRTARAALVEALRREGLVGEAANPDAALTDELALAVQAFAARTPAAVMVVQMEDVLDVPSQANLPGTVDGHPNWRRKLPLQVEAWGRDARLKRLTRTLAAIRGKTRARRERPTGLEQARIPRATYRLQLHGGFTFRDATALVPYLARLGASHAYCSPFLRARPGSTHGYDVVDHASLNPQIGTEAELHAFLAALREHGMAHDDGPRAQPHGRARRRQRVVAGPARERAGVRVRRFLRHRLAPAGRASRRQRAAADPGRPLRHRARRGPPRARIRVFPGRVRRALRGAPAAARSARVSAHPRPRAARDGRRGPGRRGPGAAAGGDRRGLREPAAARGPAPRGDRGAQAAQGNREGAPRVPGALRARRRPRHRPRAGHAQRAPRRPRELRRAARAARGAAVPPGLLARGLRRDQLPALLRHQRARGAAPWRTTRCSRPRIASRSSS